MQFSHLQLTTATLGGSILFLLYLYRNYQPFRLIIIRMVKRFHKLTNGSSEIERILLADTFVLSKHTVLFYGALEKSKTLRDCWQVVKEGDFDVERVVKVIVRKKGKHLAGAHHHSHQHQYHNHHHEYNQNDGHGGGNPTGMSMANGDTGCSSLFEQRINLCLQTIRQQNLFIQSVQQQKQESYHRNNKTHEDLLESLWQLFYPEILRKNGRYSEDWSKLGFQGQDPATDFRGGGLLSLKQLVYIATTENDTCKKMLLQKPLKEIAKYPWACCGIQITHNMVKMLEERMLDKYMYGKSREDCMNVFNGYYADLFVLFHKKWMAANPENVFDYPKVFESVVEVARKSIERSGEVPRQIGDG